MTPSMAASLRVIPRLSGGQAMLPNSGQYISAENRFSRGWRFVKELGELVGQQFPCHRAEKWEPVHAHNLGSEEFVVER